MSDRLEKITRVTGMSDEEINTLISELCDEHHITVPYRKFTNSLNAIRRVEDFASGTLYRWIELYESWLNDIKDPKTPIWNVPPRHKAEAIILASNLV